VSKRPSGPQQIKRKNSGAPKNDHFSRRSPIHPKGSMEKAETVKASQQQRPEISPGMPSVCPEESMGIAEMVKASKQQRADIEPPSVRPDGPMEKAETVKTSK